MNRRAFIAALVSGTVAASIGGMAPQLQAQRTIARGPGCLSWPGGPCTLLHLQPGGTWRITDQRWPGAK